MAVVGASSASALEPAGTAEAGTFRDSIGVATHDTYWDTPYGQRDRVVASLRTLGVEHVRDGLYTYRDPGSDARYRGDLDAFARAGIKLTLVANRDCAGGGALPACVAVLKQRAAVGGIEAVEWPHEEDRFGGGSWAAPLESWGRELFGLVKTDPALRPLTVIGPSLARVNSPALLGDQSQYLDAGNIHPFTGGTSPNPAAISAELRRIAPVSKGKPVYATAAGFDTSPAVTVADQPPTDERTAAIYSLRTYLEHFSDGIRRTFLYELLDERADPGRGDSNFGLLRADFSPKPAYTALRNLLSLVGTGGPRSLVPLRYAVSTDAPDLRQVVLQRADGSYLVFLWRTASVWNRDARQSIAVAPRSVTLTVPSASSFGVASPSDGTAFVERTVDSSKRIDVPVGGDVRVLRVSTPSGDAVGVTALGAPTSVSGTGASIPVARSGAGAASQSSARAKIAHLQVKRIGRTSVATFVLNARIRASGRIERRSGKPLRYRMKTRLGLRALPAGKRKMTLGHLPAGRHRLRISFRDAKGSRPTRTIVFTIKAVHPRR